MEVENFDYTLKYINLNGVTLNVDEKLQLKLSLGQLQSELALENIFFWGKIIGTCISYLIYFRNC